MGSDKRAVSGEAMVLGSVIIIYWGVRMCQVVFQVPRKHDLIESLWAYKAHIIIVPIL